MDDLLKLREQRINANRRAQSVATLVLMVGTADTQIPIRGKYKNLKEVYKRFQNSLDSETAYITIKGEVNGLPFKDTFRMSDIVGMRLIQGDYHAGGD